MHDKFVILGDAGAPLQAKPDPVSSAEDAMTTTLWVGRLPVWQFHALALVAMVLGSVFVVIWWPERYPDESELVKLSGRVTTVAVRDDISDSTAGAILPGWASTYFTLEGVDGEFRYPPSHPNNLMVRDQTSAALDVWVERTTIGSNEPLVIWQIREHNPYKREHRTIFGEETFVSHAEIVERLTKVDRSMVKAGAGLLVLALVFVLLGVGAKWWNLNLASRES